MLFEQAQLTVRKARRLDGGETLYNRGGANDLLE